MAGIEQRSNKTTDPSWRVYWRENGQRQTELFTAAEHADRFKKLVEGSGNRWPVGWVKGQGFASEAGDTGDQLLFRDWSKTAVGLRTKANDRTKADYLRDLELHAWPLLGGLPVDGIDVQDVADWHTTLFTAGHKPKTIQNYHGLVSSIMDQGTKQRPPVCDHNPFAGRLPQMPGVRVEEMVFLTPAEFDLVYACIPAFYKALTLLLWATGLRYGEATALRVGDLVLDGKRRTLTVVRAWKRQKDGTYKIGEPKTRRSRRTLTLSPKLVAALRPLAKGRPADAYVFPAREGGQLLNSTFHDSAWTPALRRASVCAEHLGQQQETDVERSARLARQVEVGKRIRTPAARPCHCDGVLKKVPRIHDLRHSHASLLIADGHSLVVISRRLGHASIQVTIDRYGHLSPELDDAVNASVDGSLSWALDDEDDE